MINARLTDERVMVTRLCLRDAHRTAEHAEARKMLDADHDQAREDVRRLATELRQMAPWRYKGVGAYCWCPSVGYGACSCFDRTTGAPTARGCIQKNVLLSEVGP